MSVRVKVCGITSYEDAAMAVDYGAAALGFNFHPSSPRFIERAAAGKIIRRLPPFVTTVGVFVNVADPDEVGETALNAGVQVIQLHGDESAEYCRRLGAWSLIKAVHITRDWDPASIRDFPVRAILFDSKDDGLFGGTGRAFDWQLLRNLSLTMPVILAGGLNPSNVAEAVRSVRPYALDVCSGVERTPGKKDPIKMRAFMNEVFNAAG